MPNNKENVLLFIANLLDGKNPPCPKCGNIQHTNDKKTKISYFHCKKCGFKVNIN